jgi:hypothetical protein
MEVVGKTEPVDQHFCRQMDRQAGRQLKTEVTNVCFFLNVEWHYLDVDSI